MSPELDLTIDATEAKKELDSLTKQTEKTLTTALTVARKGIQLLSLFTAGSKDVVTKSMIMLAQAALITAETVTAISAAEATTVVGAINAALGFAAAASLFLQAGQIMLFAQQAGTEFDTLDRGITAANIVFAGW